MTLNVTTYIKWKNYLKTHINKIDTIRKNLKT